MAGKRASLASLVQAVPPVPAPTATSASTPPAQPPTDAAVTGPEFDERGTVQASVGEAEAAPRARRPAKQAAAQPAPKLPPYLQLVRKETRIRERQYDDLTDLARRLERRRGTNQGERITENTLIRVAIDLLLERASRLEGISEEEIRKSATS